MAVLIYIFWFYNGFTVIITTFVCRKLINMDKLNRLKVVLAEKDKTNKWLAEQIGRDQATISKWCTNTAQPSLEALIAISQCLEVSIEDLIRMPEQPKKIKEDNE